VAERGWKRSGEESEERECEHYSEWRGEVRSQRCWPAYPRLSRVFMRFGRFLHCTRHKPHAHVEIFFDYACMSPVARQAFSESAGVLSGSPE
jgi:hypothetical protein